MQKHCIKLLQQDFSESLLCLDERCLEIFLPFNGKRINQRLSPSGRSHPCMIVSPSTSSTPSSPSTQMQKSWIRLLLPALPPSLCHTVSRLPTCVLGGEGGSNSTSSLIFKSACSFHRRPAPHCWGRRRVSRDP